MGQDDRNRIQIKVHKRLPQGTILIWETRALTAEQKSQYALRVRRITDQQWLVPGTALPDLDKMKNVMSNQHQTIMILHDEFLREDTPFIAKFTFGKVAAREASVKVAGRGSQAPYVKPIRTQSGIYAMPVVIVDDYRGGMPLPDQPLTKKEEDAEDK
jgi:hypothetical protein